MDWGQQCGCEAPRRACPSQRPSAPLWLYSLGLVITFPQSSPHGNQTLSNLQTTAYQPESHPDLWFHWLLLHHPGQSGCSDGLCPRPTGTQPLAAHLCYWLLIICSPACSPQVHLVFAQQLQASSGLAKAVWFSAIQGPNHPFSHEVCTPSMSFFGCSPSVRGYQMEFPFSYSFFLIKKIILILNFSCWPTVWFLSLGWTQAWNRGHGKAEECPPWSYEQVDKQGDRKENKGEGTWGRRECRQRVLVIFLLLSPESGS